MSAAALLDELLAGFNLPADSAQPSPTPAKAAKAANPEHPCGSTADSGPCEGLRNFAIPGPRLVGSDSDSQEFADLRNPGNGPQSEQRRGFSQDSQDSQGLPPSEQVDDDVPADIARGAELARFQDRRARLMRWGWAADAAEAMARRLQERDDHADYRHLCVECRYYRPGRCTNHKAADLQSHEVGRELAVMFQHCPGFAS